MESRSLVLGASCMAFCLLVAQALAYTKNGTAPMVPAVIVFGDSIVDTGNNNVLETIVKCNFPPYGQDFINHQPTGRFSNGKVPSDFIASAMGVKELVPPYIGYDLQSEDILTGVTFASGATGYDPLTSTINVISMTDQLQLFEEYKERMKAIAGEERTATILSNSLYVVCCGTDDIANTYFTTPLRKPHYDIPSYVNLLITGASTFLEKLVGMGAQKIGFVSLPPIGCIPSQRTLGGGILRDCEPTRNQAAQLFNSKIKKRIDKIAGQHKGIKIIYIDIYSILLDLMLRPSKYGFEVSTKGCCGTGELEASVLCNKVSASTCSDITKYVFWDSYHPTERAYKIIVDKIYQDYIKFLL
ncbi:GDSL esterase/lipase EXL3 isoform X2 [Elaeis guineensis]|uniref:GDSL esterase/lipase EXL3 isoform X2 n=1 Tax=Elaeis guineensis var. tenera TaxID=51953 RepID=A0A6J0PP74_ELAGV|nr:GDSL esterase/lipase EXL3 isoform X2 [Elaeis guineensis]